MTEAMLIITVAIPVMIFLLSPREKGVTLASTGEHKQSLLISRERTIFHLYVGEHFFN